MILADYVKRVGELFPKAREADPSSVLAEALALWESAIMIPECDPVRCSFHCGFMRDLIVDRGARNEPLIERVMKVDVNAAASTARSAVEALELLMVAGRTESCELLFLAASEQAWFNGPKCREAKQFNLMRSRGFGLHSK